MSHRTPIRTLREIAAFRHVRQNRRTPVKTGSRRFPPFRDFQAGHFGVQKVRGSNPLGPTIFLDGTDVCVRSEKKELSG